MTEFKARIGETIVGDENDMLVAIALGSCIGVVIFDTKIKVAALAHVALPEELFRNIKKKINDIDMPGRYADTAILECWRLLEKKGAKMKNIKAKIAGGSRMFGTVGLLGSGLNIGDRNIIAVIENLKLNNIPLRAKDVGGNSSRTIKFSVKKFILNIKKGLDIYDI